MGLDTVDAAVQWVQGIRNGDKNGKLEIVFHGGEPLTAGVDFFRGALPRLSEAFPETGLRLSMQSNLWLLDDELCHLLAEYGVSVGTSLDGPEEITDAQRGEGYFRRTVGGMELARRHGLDVGCICTFTRQSAPRAGEIFDFFLHEGLGFTIHASVPPLTSQNEDWSLPPEEHGELLTRLLDSYLSNLSRVKISTLDSLCRSVSAGEGGVCTFRDCLGDYLAIAPDGGIYPCQRFAGNPAFRIASVFDAPNQEQIERSPVWRVFRQREERVKQECGECAHFAYCKGGCPYDALAAGDGEFRTLRDPYCTAYKRIFSNITDRALGEVFSEENMNAVVETPGASLLRHGPLLGLMKNDPHPRDVAYRAKQVLLAVALAANDDISLAARKLVKVGVSESAERVEQAMVKLKSSLSGTGRLNNLYLHITFGCNLRCAHCYATAEPERVGDASIPASEIVALCRKASRLGFRQAVITGGEPLVHPERDALLEGLASIKAEVKPLLVVFRTNLALPMTPDVIRKVGECADKVFVSIDGDQAFHDERRGPGSYELTVSNLRRLVESGCPAEIAITSILSADEAAGPLGASVNALAGDLGIRRVNFRPLLPIGRAVQSEMEIAREAHAAYLGNDDAAAYGFTPSASCGMGQNVDVEPSGLAIPCYALTGDNWNLGSVLGGRLKSVVESSRFKALAGHTVDSNRQCRACPLRYLCGGACRAWGGPMQDDLDAPPIDCRRLHERARSLLLSALRSLEIAPEVWTSAGLPMPDSPP